MNSLSEGVRRCAREGRRATDTGAPILFRQNKIERKSGESTNDALCTGIQK